jgi:hypothetical protein
MDFSRSFDTRKRNGSGPRKRNGVRPPFRFRRGLSGHRALVSMGFHSKRNETGVFGGVTGKASRLAPRIHLRLEGIHTISMAYESELMFPAVLFIRSGSRHCLLRPPLSRVYPISNAGKRMCHAFRCLTKKCLARSKGIDSSYLLNSAVARTSGRLKALLKQRALGLN